MVQTLLVDELAPMRLLVVEDSPSDAMLLEVALRDSVLATATIERESTLEAAQRRLATENFDAVLIDLGLPDSDGLDTFVQVSEASGEAAIVVVTGRDDIRLGEEAVRLGAQDYLPKSEARPGECGRAVDYAIRRTRLLHDLRRARDEQLEAKDRFLTHVSHELRSPLAVVHQFGSLLRDEVGGPLSADQRDLLDVLMRNVGQLRFLIDDILEGSRVQRGQVSVECGEVQLAGLFADAVAAQRPSAERRGITLEVRPSHLPSATGDTNRVREVLANLLDNAMKFTPDGGCITVEGSVAVGGEAVHVSVTDNGRGIPAEDVPRIFEQFFQVHQGDQAARSGLGLGLYLCRDLIERQGGVMWADSRPGRTAVSFSLPVMTTQADPEVVAP